MIDLSGKLRKSLKETLKKAEEAYQKGDDEEAARLFDTASRLEMQLAGYAPTRQSEIEHKKGAQKYISFAKRLRAGEIPPPQETSRKSGKKKKKISQSGDESELSNAVASLIHQSSITWNEIGGLEETKQEIKFALGISMAQKPSGMDLTTWRNMLFYGPPGTGKTLLAAATSNALKMADKKKAIFFNVKVSNVLSKYFGESTKIVSELYGMARDMSPAVVFLDEFEALAGARDSEDSGAERRILSTILSELDGLAEKGRKDIYVLTIAATNRPWDLDAAVLSRFDKKILIPLPDPITRRAILEIHLIRKGFETSVPLDRLVALTDGFSGREIDRFCKQVTNTMVAGMNPDLPGIVDQGLDAVRNYELKVRPLKFPDFEKAAAMITPQTSAEEMARFSQWREDVVEA